MSNFGVIIRRKNKNEEGFLLLVVSDKVLDTYSRDHDFIIKFGLTESEALAMRNWVEESLINLHRSTGVSMKDLVNNVFFGGE